MGYVLNIMLEYITSRFEIATEVKKIILRHFLIKISVWVGEEPKFSLE